MRKTLDEIFKEFDEEYGNNKGLRETAKEFNELCSGKNNDAVDLIDGDLYDYEIHAIEGAIEYFEMDAKDIVSLSYSGPGIMYYDVARSEKQTLEKYGLWNDEYQKKYEEIEEYERLYKSAMMYSRDFL